MTSDPSAPVSSLIDQLSRPFGSSRFDDRSSAKVDPALMAEVRHEQLKMVLGHSRLGTLVATVFAIFMALQLRDEGYLPAWLVDGWIAVKIAVAAGRTVLSVRYARLPRLANTRWGRLTDAWLLADGVVWGIGAFVMMSAPIPIAALVGAGIVGVSCIATFGLQFSLRSTAAYTVPMVSLVAVGLFLRGDEFGSIGGTGLVMLLVLLVATAAASERRLVEGLRLRLHAQSLTVEKDEALKLALRQSAVKTQFISNVSHELRTPMHGILGVARLLHLEARDSAVARRVELIEASGTHLLGLINDLLDISRIEAGQFVIRSERFELCSLVRNIGDLYTVRTADKSLAFNLTMQIDEPCWVQGDPARVRQVLHNLLGNAVKFTQRGSVALTVMYDSATGRLGAEVQDSGPGIAADELARVFEAFHQVGSAATRPFEGTGLGLTIARDIAQAMRGDISMRSTVGVGTSALFTALLPVAAPPQRDETSAGAQAPQPPAAGNCRVLIAEDDDVNAVIATAYLEHLGVIAERVRDGHQAVRAALRDVDRPDLVLMDCRMPSMDGLAATREIRNQERSLNLPRVPVIALTATSSDISRQLCLNAGMDAFMCKPYSKEQLEQVLGHWLQRPEAAAHSAA